VRPDHSLLHLEERKNEVPSLVWQEYRNYKRRNTREVPQKNPEAATWSRVLRVHLRIRPLGDARCAMATKTRRRYDEPVIPDHDDPVHQENAEASEGRRRPTSIRLQSGSWRITADASLCRSFAGAKSLAGYLGEPDSKDGKKRGSERATFTTFHRDVVAGWPVACLHLEFSNSLFMPKKSAMGISETKNNLLLVSARMSCPLRLVRVSESTWV
jgi:hypothetical protein